MAAAHGQQRNVGSILRKATFRIFLYVGLALAFLTVCALYIAYAVHSSAKARFPRQWAGLATFTPLTFWYPIREYKRYWGRLGFWFIVAGLLAVHLLAFIAVLLKYPAWRLFWFM